MSFKIGFSAEPERKQNYPDITAPKEHRAKAKKSVVDVFFPDRHLTCSYYNDMFDLKVGDIVYVDGKLEGLCGRVTNVNYTFKIKLSDVEEFVRTGKEINAPVGQFSAAKYNKRKKHLCKLDLLILDDFLLHSITDERQVKVLHEILNKRAEALKSTIVCSQRMPQNWKVMILNDEIAADAIEKRATKHYTVMIESKKEE